MGTDPNDIRLTREQRELLAHAADEMAVDWQDLVNDGIENVLTRPALHRELVRREQDIENGRGLVLEGDDSLREFFNEIKRDGRRRLSHAKNAG